jgi:phage terminase large subunit
MSDLYEPRQQFLPFHNRTNRFACLVAHRRAGKTVACVNELITRALATNKPHARYAYIAPYLNQARAIAWDYLKRYTGIFNPKVNETQLSVEFANANGQDVQIRIFGADNPDALRGLYFMGVILDEFADMRPSIWSSILIPALTDHNGWAVFIGTPKGHNAFFDVYERSRKTRDWFSLLLPASQSKILTDAQLSVARQEMTEDEYAQEYECSFEAAIRGAVYGKEMAAALKGGRIGAVPYDPALPTYTFWDLGFDDATAIWWGQIARNEIRLIDYYEASGQTISHYCELVKSKEYKYGGHYVPHDAANKLLAAGGRSIYEQMAYDHGLKSITVVAATSQQNSIEAARKTLEICWFNEAPCQDGIEALRQYQFEWDEDRQVFKSKPTHNWASHGSDAFEIMGQVWRKPIEPKEPEAPRFPVQQTINEMIAHNRRKRINEE